MTVVVNAVSTEQQSREFRVHQLRLEQATNVLKLFDNQTETATTEAPSMEVSQ